jgi:predicted DNA-binding protein (MmcQ/YjbR family)
MTYEEFNYFCRGLAATSYVSQWGDSHVWKVGGKVFAIGGWEKSSGPAFSFKTSANNFEILRDMPGFRPAPYLASRGMKWIQQYEAPGTADDELKAYLKYSHHLVSLGFSKKKQMELGLVK